VCNKHGKWQGGKAYAPNRYIPDDGFPTVKTGDIPPGYLTVPLSVDDNGKRIETMLFVGHASAIKVDNVTVQPRLSWAIYEGKMSSEEMEVEDSGY